MRLPRTCQSNCGGDEIMYVNQKDNISAKDLLEFVLTTLHSQKHARLLPPTLAFPLPAMLSLLIHSRPSIHLNSLAPPPTFSAICCMASTDCSDAKLFKRPAFLSSRRSPPPPAAPHAPTLAPPSSWATSKRTTSAHGFFSNSYSVNELSMSRLKLRYCTSPLGPR